MNLESVREYCLSLPHTTEMVQWVNDLLFKVGGKMFAVAALEPSRVVLSFKATPEQFFELQEQEGVIPAPYMARNQWLALERWEALRDEELRELLATSHRLVFEKLAKRTQMELQAGKKAAVKAKAKKKAGKSTKSAKKVVKKKSAPTRKTRRLKKKKN